MKRIGLMAALIISVCATQLWSQDNDAGAMKDKPRAGKEMRKHRDELNLTAEQQKQVDKLRSDMEKQAIDQRAKIAKAGVELHDLFKADAPDKAAISKKIQEIADLGAEAKILHVEHWFAVNKLLTPEQQKVWKKFLDERVNHRFNKAMMKHRGGMMEHDGMNGPKPDHSMEMHGGPNGGQMDQSDEYVPDGGSMDFQTQDYMMEAPPVDQQDGE